MKLSLEDQVRELDKRISVPPASAAKDVPTHIKQNLILVSGQLCLITPGKLVAAGCVGEDVSIEEVTAASRISATNISARVKSILRSLNNVKRVVRLGGFIEAMPSVRNHARDRK